MTRRWLGSADREAQRDVCAALGTVSPSGRVSFVDGAGALRQLLRDEEPRAVSVVVGMGAGGRDVSDINLAAALARDGHAAEVVLVARGVSGSLRSRAAAAGITRVVDVEEATSLARPVVVTALGEEGRPVGPARRAGEEGPADGAGQVGGDPLRGAPAGEAAPPTPDAIGRRTVPGPLVMEGGDHSGRSRAPWGFGGGGDAGFADPVAPTPRAPVITLASGRGGVGKTLLAACFAVLARSWGMRVALLDLDLCCGNLFRCFGLLHGGDLARLAAGEPAEQLGLACGEGVTLWGPCELPEMAETVMAHAGPLLGTLAASHDLVLVDTPTTCTDAVAQAMQLCDRLVLVGGPEQADIASLARVSALAVRLGVARTRIARIESRCHPRVLGQPFMPRAERGLETARAFRVVEGGTEVGELAFAGQVEALCDGGDELSRTVAYALATLLTELGSLPDSEAARHAARDVPRRPALGLFGRKREAL